MMRLENKVALVTGAGAGIGEQSCYRLAREGAAVAAMDLDEGAARRVAEAIRGEGGQALALGGDVSNEADCRAAVERTLSTWSRLDVLGNVAGIVYGGSLAEATEEQWQRSMDINAKGMWYLARLVLPRMLEQGGGSIVNIASVAGPFAVKNRGVYSVSKAAVIGLTKSLASDFVGQGIRCNAICPGTVESPSWHERVQSAPDPEEALRMMIARQPMGRVGRPEEIAAMMAYLASDEADYVTGQAFYVDGGMTM